MSQNELHALLFYTIAILTGLCAIAVVVTQNIVRSAVWLLFTLCGTAGLFFLLGTDFVAATQLIVYVGGTLVLVVFGVMLTAQGPLINLRISAAEWALSLAAGLGLFGALAVTIWTGFSGPPPAGPGYEPTTAMMNPATSNTSVLIGHGLLGQKVGPNKETSYLLAFEIVSVHLLVVLTGAAYLARAKRRRGSDHA